MKTSVILSVFLVAIPFISIKADTLVDWTFETLVSTNHIVGIGATESSVGADVGSGTASASHASASTTWLLPAGNGSAHSWSANRWAAGDYFQFSVNLNLALNTYSGIMVNYDQNGSSTGPETFYLAYSTDGTTFAKFGSDYGLASGIVWSRITPNQGTQLSFDLSSITALDTRPRSISASWRTANGIYKCSAIVN